YQRSVSSDASGAIVFFDVPHGEVTLTSELAGFRTSIVSFPFDGNPKLVQIDMQLGTGTEPMTVTAESPMRDTQREPQREPPALPPSQNVVNLQQRAAGVLPIRVDVPRAGVSHEFIKPLVVGGDATIKLRYK